MQVKIPHKRKVLCAAVSLSLLPLSGTSIAQEDTVEEVIVTGSYIRRSEGFAQASAVTQLNAEDLADEGTLNLGEVVQELSFVNGAASAITNTIQGTDSRSTSVDLRGLGASSTLTLLDGKRLVNENVNALLPTIAIQRLDIVADGAAALYGNEAVAGVVNFIPYKSFDGLRIETFAESDDENDFDSHSVQAMWGGDIGGLDVVVAGQFRQQSRLGWDERPTISQSGLTISSNAPGNYFVPARDENGQFTGDRVQQTDPNCAPASERDSFQPNKVASPFGVKIGNSCFFDFGDNRSFFEPEENSKLFANITYDYSDNLTISFQGFFSRQFEETFTSTSNPGNSRIGELPTIRGEIPGNPFLAKDANGNQLFGVDANGDGVPDRNPGVDLNNDGLDDALVSGIVDNGILLHEDVRPRTLRPINKTAAKGAGFSPDGDNLADSIDEIGRYSIQLDFNVPMVEGWRGMVSFAQNEREFSFESTQNFDITAMIQGLNCDVVNDRDACYNPFFVVDPADDTSVQVIDAIAGRSPETTDESLGVLDVVFNGNVPLGRFELPGGPIALALGYQRRDDEFTDTPSEEELAGVTWIGGTARETITRGNRTTDAFFAELSIPVLPWVELQAAVRNEDNNTGQESTDPKFGITLAPLNWLTLRATYGDAFIAPSLEQLLDPVTCGLSTVTDRFGPFSGFTTACGGGNPNLENETSETFSAGFDVDFELPFGSFDLSATYSDTEFSDRIVGTTGQRKMEADFFRFKEATGFTGSGLPGDQPTEAQLRAWVADPRSDKDIIRDSSDIFTLLQVNGLGSTNAESVQVRTIDVDSNFRFSLGNIGDFRIGLQGTYMDDFLVQEDITEPKFDAADKFNFGTGSAPNLPQIRANLRLGWSHNNHSVVSTVHYIDDINYDGPLFTFLDAAANTFRPGNITETGIQAWTDMDISYSYRGLAVLGGEFSFSVGARNVTDRQAQRVPDFAGVVGQLQDPLGRMWWARVVYDF